MTSVISITVPAGNIMPGEVLSTSGDYKEFFPNIEMVLFDKGFYSKDLIMKLNNLSVSYIIFVPKREMKKRELESMSMGEKKLIIHQYSIYSDHRKINGDTKLAFLRRIFGRKTSEHYDWVLRQIQKRRILI